MSKQRPQERLPHVRRPLTRLSTWTQPGAPRGALAVALLTISLVLVLTSDKPGALPSVALGSDVLWVLECTATIYFSMLAILYVLAESWQGRMPLLGLVSRPGRHH